MSDSDSESHHSGNTTPDPGIFQDQQDVPKNYSDPKLLFHRPRRTATLRPSGMLLTKMDGSRHMIYDNPNNLELPFVKRTVSKQSHLQVGVDSQERNPDFGSDGCPTEVTDLQENCHEALEAESNPWSDSEDYDTDLDCDTAVADMFQGEARWEYFSDDEDENKPDMVCLKDYEKACKNENAIPQTVIRRNLGNRNLDLRHRNVGNKHLKPLFAALKDNMRVQRLLLDENGLDKEGLECLANGLRDNVTVSYLSLASNPLGREGLAHVVQLLLSNRFIQGLDLTDTKLGADSVLLLTHLFKENSTLRFLDLSRNTLEEDNIRFLAAAIGENSSLDFLRISYNNIRNSGAAAIGQCITVNENLRVLDLSWNGLGYQGAVAMAASLQENETLQEVDISYNNINWQGALVLSGALAKNSTLKILRMGGNPLTTTGAMDLVEAVSSPLSDLRLLDISNVPVIFETEVLASSINRMRSFRLNHGGVVFIHDKIGRRLERQRKPMERLLDHLRERMIRPLELLREFDKQSNGRITQAEFVARLRRANVPLHGFEVRALAASVSDMKLDGTSQINYKKLIDGVEQHIAKDRMRKIRERMHRQRVRNYHSQILTDSKPLYSHSMSSFGMDTPISLVDTHRTGTMSAMSMDRMSKLSKVTAGHVLIARDSALSLAASLGFLSEKPSLPPLSKARNTTFTMSAPLDKIGTKHKKTKTKKKKLKKVAKRPTELEARETITLVSKLKAEAAAGVV